MHIVRDIASLRKARGGGALAFVPTMGGLHEGHLALVRIARSRAARVAVSIYVNRLQFGPGEDYERYPRSLERDCEKLERENVDLLFAPEERELYPEPQHYIVEPPPIADELEGRFRRRFFHGVATVVLKLFNSVQPSIAIFGKKDYQQLVIVRGMVRQFDLPIEIVAGETVRESDGLAMSSRNAYLSAAERAEAPALYRALKHIKDRITAGERGIGVLETQAVRALADSGWKPDYVELRERHTLAAPGPADRELVILGAARLGGTRLIDSLEA
jgi:pantoate--beta-alanine ligase